MLIKILKHLERQTIRLQLRLVNMKVLAIGVPKHSSNPHTHGLSMQLGG
jgi:hypothetical protein